MWWAIGIVIVLIIAGGLALQYAIKQNGPAVLDTVDRITGGSGDVVMVQKDSLGDNPQQSVAVYRVAGADPKTDAAPAAALPVIIFSHGGSWRSGSPDDYGFVARGLAPEGFVVVLAGYRLGDAGKYPAMVEDTAAAVAWTHANIANYGGDPERIFISGHSAGAYNAAMVALDRQWLGRKGLESNVLKGVIGLAGPYDFYPFDSDSTKAAFGGTPRPEQTQPINFARGDAPPFLLLSGEADTVVKPRNSRALAAAINEAGGTAKTAFFPDMDHYQIVMATASPWRRDPKIVNAIAQFVNETARGADEASVPVQAESR